MHKQKTTDTMGIKRRDVLKASALGMGVMAFGVPAFSGSAVAATVSDSMTVRSGTSSTVTGYRAGDEAGAFPTSTPNVSADLSWVHPLWSGTDHTFDAETRWIWHCDENSSTGQTVGGEPTYYVMEPVVGDVVELEDSFTIPGTPTSGTLYITADNGYEVWVNDTLVGSAQVFDDDDVDWEDSDLSQPYINAQSGSWISVEEFDVSSLLTSGSNTLTVLGGNEQQSTADGETDGTVTSNPGGVIYELDIDYEVCESESFGLCAGQDMEVGSVTVEETSDGFLVTYTTTDGWTITETHLDVESDPDDFPTNRKGNPKIGHFEYTGTHDHLTSVEYKVPFADEGCYYFAAHAVVEKVIQEAPFYAASVESFSQGLQKDGDPVRAARSDPANGLEFEAGQDESNFVSLGFGGEIVLEFDYPIVNGPGNDIKVIEDTWGLPYPSETADVYVSQDGTNFTLLGTADNSNAVGIHTISEFDLDSIGMDWAQYVKLVDTSDPDDFTGSGSSGPDADGYDLNAVEVLHDYVQEETAWVCEGEEGDEGYEEYENVYAFNEDGKGNWARYFEYCTCEFEGDDSPN